MKNFNLMQFILSSLIFAVSACAGVGVTQTKQAVAKPEDCPLDIYTNDSEIKRKFEVICLLDSKTGSTLFADKTVAGAIENARPDACKCGGDGTVSYTHLRAHETVLDLVCRLDTTHLSLIHI